jgi:arylformamidase
MQVIDLSHTIEPGMPCYPGTPQPEIHPIATIARDGFAEHLLSLSSHTGTHVDLPTHMFSDASSLDSFAVNQFAGKGVALDVRSVAGGEISKEMLMPFSSMISECEFLLFCSGWSAYWGSDDYFKGYPVLALDAARWLAGFHLKGIGVDMISVDLADSVDFPVHKILLQNGLVLFENLTALEPLLHSPFIFCGLPIKIAGAEASPTRAVAFIGKKGLY